MKRFCLMWRKSERSNGCVSLASISGTILLILTSLLTVGQNRLPGYYSSNVAESGFFATKIQLNPDSTFKYEFRGDLMYNKGTGRYKVQNKRLILLTFDKDENTDPMARALGSNGKRPTRLYYKNGKLYEFGTNGELVKKGQAFSRHKKFLIFGYPYMRTRKVYLKRRKGNLVWLGEDKND